MDNINQTDLLVIPIVGLGGLGKTTLAKLAYNDTEISRSFELRMWTCVSEDSKLNKVIERIVESATGETCEGLHLDQLQIKLRRILNSKKFLLVLDDLWEDDRSWWTKLRGLLVGGAVGSTVIVTTRNSNIGSIVRTTTASYNLSELLFNDCLSLFLKCAFEEGKEKEHPELMKTGKEIVKKCGGVPLAVRFLGSLLYMKTEVGEWSYIMNNDILALEQKENDILPALRLSYEQLPAYLKPCFVYCCIFPKSVEIPGYVLINQWIAQGLLESRLKNERLEDIGYRYLNELLSRSFFQDARRGFNNSIQSVKMHDLVHDLARSMAGTESLKVDIDSSLATSENVRHLLFTGWDLLHVEFPKSLVSAKKSGQSKHYGFVEFESPEVSKIVADSMHYQLLFEHLLQVHLVPPERVHPKLWKGTKRRFKPFNWVEVEQKRHNKERTLEEQKKLAEGIMKRELKRKKRIEAAGIDYECPKIAGSDQPASKKIKFDDE